MSRADIRLIFDRPPSAWRFMANALFPSPGLLASREIPPISAHWQAHVADRGLLRDFALVTGLVSDNHLALLYPYVFGFRLPMVILTHPAFPLPIWRALQIRTRIMQSGPIPINVALMIDCEIAGRRILEKGAEFDLCSTVRLDGETVWRGINTFYYRGRFGEAVGGDGDTRSPEPPQQTVAEWQIEAASGSLLARMTGDYNGVHRWGWYARRLGFARAFFHPQLLAAQCLARLPATSRADAQCLDLWVKGPVYFGSRVRLTAQERGPEVIFALRVEYDERPALIGRWRHARCADGAV